MLVKVLVSRLKSGEIGSKSIFKTLDARADGQVCIALNIHKNVRGFF